MKPINVARAGALVAVLCLSALGVLGQNGSQPPANQAPQNSQLPATNSGESTGTAQGVDHRTYEIGVQDELRIEVYQDPTLNRNVVVRTDGMFSMPLLKDVRAEGLTPERLRAQLTEGLSAFYAMPDVTVSVIAVRSKTYWINGQVNRPGQYQLVTPIQVYQAIISAGGFQEWVNKKKIVIMRGTQRLEFNANDFEKGKNLDGNIFLQANDIITIPR